MSPAKPADKETLLRRVSLDLTGLPPTLEEIDDFLKDESTDAYEKVVDRLLDSCETGICGVGLKFCPLAAGGKSSQSIIHGPTLKKLSNFMCVFLLFPVADGIFAGQKNHSPV